MMRVRNLTLVKEIGGVTYRDTGSVAKQIAVIKVRDTVGLKTYFTQGSGLAVDVPGFASGAGSSLSTIAVATETIIATASGGQAPYAYLWEAVDLFGNSWTIVSPNGSATYFRANAVPASDSQTATFRCTVTDARGNSVISITIVATADNFGGFA